MIRRHGGGRVWWVKVVAVKMMIYMGLSFMTVLEMMLAGMMKMTPLVESRLLILVASRHSQYLYYV